MASTQHPPLLLTVTRGHCILSSVRDDGHNAAQGGACSACLQRLTCALGLGRRRTCETGLQGHRRSTRGSQGQTAWADGDPVTFLALKCSDPISKGHRLACHATHPYPCPHSHPLRTLAN